MPSSLPLIEKRVKTYSEEETIRLGERLGATFRAGDIVSLIGELGAGKTTLAKGICKGVGVDDKRPVRSPTFTVINDYQGRIPVRHADLYRIEGEEDLETIGLFDPAITAVTIIEWGERLDKNYTFEMMEITINEFDVTGREIVIRAPLRVVEKFGI